MGIQGSEDSLYRLSRFDTISVCDGHTDGQPIIIIIIIIRVSMFMVLS